MTNIDFIADLLKEPEYTYVPRKLIIPDKKPPQQYDPILIERTMKMVCIYQDGRESERCTNFTYYLFQGLPFCRDHLAVRFDWFMTHNGEPWRYEDA